MDRIAQHKVLVAGDSFEHCCDQVRRFFDLTSLVMYDCIEVREDKCVSGLENTFLDAVKDAENQNRKMVASLIDELQQTGISTLAELKDLEHGYPSKILHVLSHLLDGFIGIDSYFYNLPSDSHWLGTDGRRDIAQSPEQYWLIHIDCFSTSPEEASLIRM